MSSYTRCVLTSVSSTADSSIRRESDRGNGSIRRAAVPGYADQQQPVRTRAGRVAETDAAGSRRTRAAGHGAIQRGGRRRGHKVGRAGLGSIHRHRTIRTVSVARPIAEDIARVRRGADRHHRTLNIGMSAHRRGGRPMPVRRHRQGVCRQEREVGRDGSWSASPGHKHGAGGQMHPVAGAASRSLSAIAGNQW